jgi:ABC-type molybdenum transport system ATPase subunit/photorepair protein PhrA
VESVAFFLFWGNYSNYKRPASQPVTDEPIAGVHGSCFLKRAVSLIRREEIMKTAIELKDVTKKFGQTTAVKDLNLSIPEGGLYGFIGPNGAGKTTTIRMVMSILFPDFGTLSVLGFASVLASLYRNVLMCFACANDDAGSANRVVF